MEKSLIDSAIEMAEGLLPQLIEALAILVIGWIVVKWAKRLFTAIGNKSKWDSSVVTFVVNLVDALLKVGVLLAAAGAFGVDTTSFIAIMGAVGLAVGMALKDSLGNFAGGVLVLLLKPFRVGDVIEISGIIGTVKSIELFATELLTPDNKVVIMPNGPVSTDTIINYSRMETRRVDIAIGIGYDDDIKGARALLESIVAKHPLVLNDPAPAFPVKSLGASSVDFSVRVWTKTADYWKVFFELQEEFKIALEENGYSIPFNQMDLHLHNPEALK